MEFFLFLLFTILYTILLLAMSGIFGSLSSQYNKEREDNVGPEEEDSID